MYLDNPNSIYHPIADTILKILRSAHVNVRNTQTWNTIYHHGFMENPFDELVERSYMNTRSKCLNLVI